MCRHYVQNSADVRTRILLPSHFKLYHVGRQIEACWEVQGRCRGIHYITREYFASAWVPSSGQFWSPTPGVCSVRDALARRAYKVGSRRFRSVSTPEPRYPSQRVSVRLLLKCPPIHERVCPESCTEGWQRTLHPGLPTTKVAHHFWWKPLPGYV